MLQKPSSRSVMPPALIMLPARIKKGTAIRIGESIPVKMRWAARTNGVSPRVIIAASGVNPRTKAIGTPISRKKMKANIKVKTTMGTLRTLLGVIWQHEVRNQRYSAGEKHFAGMSSSLSSSTRLAEGFTNSIFRLRGRRRGRETIYSAFQAFATWVSALKLPRRGHFFRASSRKKLSALVAELLQTIEFRNLTFVNRQSSFQRGSWDGRIW